VGKTLWESTYGLYLPLSLSLLLFLLEFRKKRYKVQKKETLEQGYKVFVPDMVLKRATRYSPKPR
jgi:hypothetical protein